MKNIFKIVFKGIYSERYIFLMLIIGYLLFSIHERNSFMTYIENILGVSIGIVIYDLVKATIKVSYQAYRTKAIEKRRIENAKLKEARRKR